MTLSKAEQRAKDQFLADCSSHEMTVLHDDGLYRHLRFQSPGKNSWYLRYDLVTWPGYLTITGDMGAYVFVREPDMIEFFRDSRHGANINAHYWAQKVQATERPLRRFEPDLLWAHIQRCLDEQVEDEVITQKQADDFMAYRSDLEWTHGEEYSGLRHGLADLGVFDDILDDTYEDDFSEHDHHFLLACHAILWGSNKYHAHRTKAEDKQPYPHLPQHPNLRIFSAQPVKDVHLP